MDLEGRIAVVTGGARGTGAAIARRLVDYGARVVLGDVLDDQGRAVASELGAAAIYENHDVTSQDAWEKMAARAVEWGGRVDILVNNAAVLHLGTIAHTPEDVFRRVLDVNTIGPFLGLQAVTPQMREQGGGSIVNVTSIDALIGMNGLSAYCTSKWALRGMTKAAALELGRDGIRVNCVCPAGGNPEMYTAWIPAMSEFLEETMAYSNDRGIPGAVALEQIAEAVCFLASDASRHCTGIDLPVDGGAQAGRFLAGFNTL